MWARLDIWTAAFTETGNHLFYKKSGQVNNFLFNFYFKKHKIVETGRYLRFDQYMDSNIHQLNKKNHGEAQTHDVQNIEFFRWFSDFLYLTWIDDKLTNYGVQK